MKHWHQRVSILVWVVEIWRRSPALSLGVSVPPRFACLTLNNQLKMKTAWKVSNPESWLCMSIAKSEMSWIITSGIIIEGAATLFLPTSGVVLYVQFGLKSKIHLTCILNSCSISVIWLTVTTLSKHSLLRVKRCKRDALRQVHGCWWNSMSI